MDFVIFERAFQCEKPLYESTEIKHLEGKWFAQMDWRTIRAALPQGSCPLYMKVNGKEVIDCGQWFDREEIRVFAEKIKS